MASICSLDPELIVAANKLKLNKAKTISALFFKIDKATTTVKVEEKFEDTTIDELREELPHQQPRYVALSYVHKYKDGRVSYPFILIYISPQDCSPKLQMMYAGTKKTVAHECEFTKVIELRSAEEFTDETVIAHVSKFDSYSH